MPEAQVPCATSIARGVAEGVLIEVDIVWAPALVAPAIAAAHAASVAMHPHVEANRRTPAIALICIPARVRCAVIAGASRRRHSLLATIAFDSCESQKEKPRIAAGLFCWS